MLHGSYSHSKTQLIDDFAIQSTLPYFSKMNTNVQVMQLPLNEAGHHAHLDWFTILSFTAAATQLCKYIVPNKSEAS